MKDVGTETDVWKSPGAFPFASGEPPLGSAVACARLQTPHPFANPTAANTSHPPLALRYRLVQLAASRRANSTHLRTIRAVRFPNSTRIRERKHPAAGHVLTMTFYLRKMYPRGLQFSGPKRAQWGCLPGLAAWPPSRRAKNRRVSGTGNRKKLNMKNLILTVTILCLVLLAALYFGRHFQLSSAPDNAAATAAAIPADAPSSPTPPPKAARPQTPPAPETDWPKPPAEPSTAAAQTPPSDRARPGSDAAAGRPGDCQPGFAAGGLLAKAGGLATA